MSCSNLSPRRAAPRALSKNLLRPSLYHTISHAVVRSTQGGELFSVPLTCSTMMATAVGGNALSSSQTHPKLRCTSAARILCRDISLSSHPIRDLLLTVLEHEQEEAAVADAAGSPRSSSSSPPSNAGGQVARRDGQVTQVRVVCCKEDNHCLRPLSYICTWGEVR